MNGDRPDETTAAVAPSQTGGTPNPRILNCNDYIGTVPPPARMQVVDDVVAFPASPRMAALQTADTGHAGAHRLFAKWGLTFRTGEMFTLAIPRRLRSDAAVGWGSSARPVARLTVPACQVAGAGWLSYAGGYWVRDPLCLPLFVTIHGDRQTIHIGVGAPCPGQRPPPQPTQR